MNHRIFALSHYQFILVTGPDARKFLQGQLSCNMDLLNPQRSLRAALCNLKGRVIADLRVLQRDEDCLLQTAPDMASTVLATLSKYAVFSKVKLDIMATPPQAFGVLGTDSDALLTEMAGELPASGDGVSQSPEASVIRLVGPQSRYEVWIHEASAANAFRERYSDSFVLDLDAWNREEIVAGVVHVDPANTEEHTPQLLNYDISGVIDFKKGCYTGQEVVARMFYRGTAKKRLYLATSAVPVSADTSVYQLGTAEEKSAPIIAFHNGDAQGQTGSVLLTILSTDAVDSGQEFALAGRPEAAVQVKPLSY